MIRGRRDIFWSILLPAVPMLAVLTSLAATPAEAQSAGMESCLAFDRAACGQVLAAEPDNLTALFMRGLAAELAGDDAAALQDFDATAQREKRHFGAQLWREIAAASLGQSRKAELQAYLDGAKQLGEWPRVLAELYLGTADAGKVLALAREQPGAAGVEALCAAEYHAGRMASLAGRQDEATAHFRAALATGAAHVFEFQAAERALTGKP